MNRIFSTTGVLALLALLMVFATVMADQPWPGFPTLQSTAPTTPCLTATDQRFTFAFYGYLNHPDGTSTLTWQVTNSGKHDISHVAFGAAGWTRLAPQPGSLYRGELGDYPVEWTKDKGNPGFASVKYETQFDGFSQEASDTFTLTVSGFDPATPVQVQAKAGRTVGVVAFTLADPACDRTPAPTPASPLPTPTPNPDLTLDDYSFGEPRVVMTSPFASLAVLDWLPDNRRAIIMPGESFEIQTLDVTTGVTVTYGNIGPTYPHAVWLEAAQKMAFRSAAGRTRLLLSDGINEPAIVTHGNFRQSLAGHGNKVMVLNEGAESPLLFDGDSNSLPVPPINLLAYGLNTPMRPYGPEICWHPFEDRVAMFDIGGLLIFDLLTGEVQDFDLNDNDIQVQFTERFSGGPFWAVNGEWSPDGQNIAFKLVLGMPTPFFKQSWLVILNPASHEVTSIPLPFEVLLDLAWAPNSRQLLVVGKERISGKEGDANIFLADVSTNEVRLLDQFSTSALGGYGGYTLAWSPDGYRLVYRCRSDDMPTDVFALCETKVTLGVTQ